jgi:hypothetical protein
LINTYFNFFAIDNAFVFSVIDHTEVATNDLVNFIETSSLDRAERAAKYLAQSRANLQFNLTNHNDKQNKTVTKKQDTKSSSNLLRFVHTIYFSTLLPNYLDFNFILNVI